MTYDVVGVGANSVDFVYRLPAYPRPDSAFAKLPISHHVVSCGGQVTTALATCAAMGLRTAYVGTVGSDDNARRMRAELDARGIDASNVVSREGTNPFAVILLDDREGERVVLWSRGPHLRLTPRDITPDVFTGATLVHVDDVDLDASIAAARIARERRLPVTSDIERTSDEVRALVEAITGARRPLVVTSYLGRNRDAPGALARVCNRLGIGVLDSAPGHINFPTDDPLYQGNQWNQQHQNPVLAAADLVLVIDSDIPWIPLVNRPAKDAVIYHIDVDPLKQQTPLWHIPARRAYRADAATALEQIEQHLAGAAIDEAVGGRTSQ